MSLNLKSDKDIEIIREGGKILAAILRRTAAKVQPGISTAELNKYAEAEIIKAGGRPAFKGYGDPGNPFPAGLCTSINSVVVHGIPSKKGILKSGDIIKLDIGMEYKGRYTDTAVTVAVGDLSKQTQKLIDVTKQCLAEAIKQAKVGNRIGDISATIQKTAESAGFNVVRDLVGHGVGFAVHEDPAVPCYGRAGTGVILKPGMVLAIEPMVTIGDYNLQFEDDGWAISTVDGSLAAQFEHTVAITDRGPEVLTA